MTYNCEFIGTTTLGCDEELVPPGEGGGGDEEGGDDEERAGQRHVAFS